MCHAAAPCWSSWVVYAQKVNYVLSSMHTFFPLSLRPRNGVELRLWGPNVLDLLLSEEGKRTRWSSELGSPGAVPEGGWDKSRRCTSRPIIHKAYLMIPGQEIEDEDIWEQERLGIRSRRIVGDPIAEILGVFPVDGAPNRATLALPWHSSKGFVY